jgi:hypothetical protein
MPKDPFAAGILSKKQQSDQQLSAIAVSQPLSVSPSYLDQRTGLTRA